MKKRILGIILTMAVTISMAMPAFAEWKYDESNFGGWWWRYDDGSWPSNKWLWLDGNGDGVAECYWFNNRGYLLANTTTPDGYTVNVNGAWTVNGEEIKKPAD